MTAAPSLHQGPLTERVEPEPQKPRERAPVFRKPNTDQLPPVHASMEQALDKGLRAAQARLTGGFGPKARTRLTQPRTDRSKRHKPSADHGGLLFPHG